jgi:hypothetical protein
MPNVQYKQTYANSCGASALLCAAMELGVQLRPKNKAWPLWMASAAMAADKTTETTLYSVTSGGNGAPPGPNAGYSLPSNIGECAAALNLSCTVHVPTWSVIAIVLKTAYSSEMDAARAAGMKVVDTAMPTPGQNQRGLRVFRVGADSATSVATGLHWVMTRPDGSVMDPALGMDVNSIDGLVLGQKLTGAAYVDTDIGIILKLG